jgi:predicted transcriptional regulator
MTHIVYRANLNFRLAKQYFSFLISNGFVTHASPENGTTRPYRLTDKGEKLLFLLEQVEKELQNMFSYDAQGIDSSSAQNHERKCLIAR